MTVELALTPDGRWDIATPDLVVATADAGFSALGLSAQRVDQGTAATLAGAGLRCHEVLALVLTDDAEATLAAATTCAEAAAAVGAPWVLTVFRTPLTPAAADIVAASAARFAEAGAAMAVEFSPFGPVTSIPAGLEVVAAAGAGRAGLMIDTWHFSFGDSTWDDLATVPLEQIAYVQFADAPAPETTDLMHETMDRRALPGDGILELERFASVLLERGWSGVVSVEVLNAELLALPVPEFARRARAATSRYWR